MMLREHVFKLVYHIMKLKYIEVSPSYSIINTVLWNTAGREQHIKKQYEELEEVEEEEVSNLTIVS